MLYKVVKDKEVEEMVKDYIIKMIGEVKIVEKIVKDKIIEKL